MHQLRAVVKLIFGLLTLWLALIWAKLLARPDFLPPEMEIEPLTLVLGTTAVLLFGFWKSGSAHAAAPEPTLEEKLIADFKKKYQKRETDKLVDRHPVNLIIRPTTIGLSEESKENSVTIEDEDISGRIGETFDKASGRLLIIGLPGAGKTTILLKLALDLIDRAERMARLEGVQPAIPVLLNLATWRKEYNTFDEWLSRILPHEFGAPKDLAEKIRTEIPLILLLDGFDEVPESDRNPCIEALREFGRNNRHRYAMTSRVETIENSIEVRNFNERVEVVPLTVRQVEANLAAQSGARFPGAMQLYKAIQKDEHLKTSLKNPFYLNTAQMLFASEKNWSEFGFIATDVAGRQKELVERFVEYALTHKNPNYKNSRDYQPEKAKKWLVYLAGKMEEEELRVFELLNLQPNWWGQSWWHRLVVVGFLGLWALVFALLFKIKKIIVGIFCLIVGVQAILGWIKMDISSPERTHWSWNLFASSWKKWAISGIRVGMKGSLSYCFSASVLFVVFKMFDLGDLDDGFLKRQYLYSLAFVPLMVWIRLLQAGDVSDFSLILKSPYQRFTSNLSLTRLRIVPFSLLLHTYLRLLLYLQSSLPLRLVYFLNEMSRRHLLEFDGNLDTETGGGSWRWRHRIIQEHFLTMNDERATMNE